MFPEFDTYDRDVVICTEPWLSEEISNAKFLGLITQPSEETDTRGGGVFICVKNYFTCADLWVDEVYEMTTVEVKCRDPNIT